jgi:glycosyltransferase involved in cell wall biosynthesis
MPVLDGDEARTVSDPLRVVMVVRQFYPWVGGTERQAQKLSAKLIALGLDVRVVTGWWQWRLPQRQRVGTVPVFRHFTGSRLLGVRGLRKLAGYVYILSLLWHLWRTRREYDIIHVHLLNYAAWPAVLAGRWLGKKTLIKLANSGRRSDILRMRQNDLIPGQRQMLPLTLRADCFVALNAEISAELCAAGVPPERIVHIPNGVEVERHPTPRNYRLDDHVTVLFIGRLFPSKDLPTLLRAFRRVVDMRPNYSWRLWLVGDGPLRRELEVLVNGLGLVGQVTFCGQAEEVSSQLAQADIFVLPSVAEGMSNALLEAMAHSLPCIATQIASNLELIRHGETGLLVPPENDAALAQALASLADDEALRSRLGQRARQWVDAEYSLDSVARRYLALYRSLAQLPNARPETVTC